MSLRDLAKQAVVMDGQLTIWMMPYLTLKNDIVQAAFEKVVPRDEWGYIHNTFLIVEGVMIDVEAAPNAGLEAQALAYYWRNRNGSIAANWDSFTQVAGGKAYGAIWDAWNATRDTTIEDPEANERRGDDPEASSAASDSKAT